MKMVFIHGLESSSRGSKARYFADRFSDMLIRDYTGGLGERLTQLEGVLAGTDDLIMVGSSFGGLMATIYAMENQGRVKKLVLLAPALNFPDFSKYTQKNISTPTHLYIGNNDTITPPHLVEPAARKIFSDLIVHAVEDDHLLGGTFRQIPWDTLLA